MFFAAKIRLASVKQACALEDGPLLSSVKNSSLILSFYLCDKHALLLVRKPTSI